MFDPARLSPGGGPLVSVTYLVDLLRREPVRCYVYSVLAALLVALVTLGFVDANVVPALLGLAGTVLAVPAVELARSQVKPTYGGDK